MRYRHLRCTFFEIYAPIRCSPVTYTSIRCRPLRCMPAKETSPTIYVHVMHAPMSCAHPVRYIPLICTACEIHACEIHINKKHSRERYMPARDIRLEETNAYKRCVPARNTYLYRCLREMHARERYRPAREACERGPRERHVHKMHIHEMHAYEMHADKMYARKGLSFTLE
jgi:hypothetical protein